MLIIPACPQELMANSRAVAELEAGGMLAPMLVGLRIAGHLLRAEMMICVGAPLAPQSVVTRWIWRVTSASAALIDSWAGRPRRLHSRFCRGRIVKMEGMQCLKMP